SRAGCQRRERRRGMTPSEVRLLGVVGAELRAEVLAGRGTPEFDVAVAEAERLAAERAVERTAVWKIPAAGEHANHSFEGEPDHGVVMAMMRPGSLRFN